MSMARNVCAKTFEWGFRFMNQSESSCSTLLSAGSCGCSVKVCAHD